MKVGSKVELAIPPDLAYGSQGPLANQVLLFEVELLSVASATGSDQRSKPRGTAMPYADGQRAAPRIRGARRAVTRRRCC